MFWSSTISILWVKQPFMLKLVALAHCSYNLRGNMSAASLLTKVVIKDLFGFDITENVFESNIDLILGCIGCRCTAQLTI